MENLQQIVNALIEKKAKENNTIDLNAYAIGALDALEKSKYSEMLEMIMILLDGSSAPEWKIQKAKQLIKEATKL